MYVGDENSFKQHLTLYHNELKLNNINKLELIHKIGSSFNSTNFWQKENLIEFSKYMEDEDVKIKMTAFNYLCDLVVDNDRMHHFNKVFLNLRFEEMNTRLECLGIFCIVRTNIILNRDLYFEIDNKLENEKLCKILYNQKCEEEDSKFTEHIYSYLYEFLDKKLRIVIKKKNFELDPTINFVIKLTSGLLLKKFFQERPLEIILRKNMILSNDEKNYVCMNLNNLYRNITIYFIENIVNLEEYSNACLSPSAISSIISVFLNYYDSFVSANDRKQNNLDIKSNNNDMIIEIYEKVSLLYHTPEYKSLVSNSFIVFTNFLFKNLGFMGACYFQKSIYYRSIFNCVFDVFKDQIINLNSCIHKIGIKKSITSKFIYLLTIYFIENNKSCTVNLMYFFKILFENCIPEHFSFLENLISILSKNEIKDNEQYENLWFILGYANQMNLFIYDDKFLKQIEGLLQNKNKEDIFVLLSKVSQNYTGNSNWKWFVAPNFYENFLLLLDNHYLLSLWQLFFKTFARCMKNYKSKYDVVYVWITTKLSDHNLPLELMNVIENYSIDLHSNKNPIIKEFLKNKKKENFPEMKIHQEDNYEDFMDSKDISLSNINIKILVDESICENKTASSIGSTKNTSENMTNVEKEEDIKQKVREIIKISQNKRDYYEEIFQNLVLEVQLKNKSLTAIISNLLSIKIYKCLNNLNREIITNNKVLAAHINNSIKKYMNHIYDKNYSFAHIILKTQISANINYVNIYLTGMCPLEKKIFENFIENCFKSLYVEANRAYNKYTGKGDFSTIHENEQEEQLEIISNLEESNLYENSFSKENLNESNLKEPFVCDDSIDEISYSKDNNQLIEDVSEIFDEIFENKDLKSSTNLTSQEKSSSKGSIAYSKFSHIFSFTGYTNTLSKTRNDCMKEVSLLLKSNFIPFEVKNKFKEFAAIIIEVSFLYGYREQYNGISHKLEDSIKKWVTKNKSLLEKNNIFYELY